MHSKHVHGSPTLNRVYQTASRICQNIPDNEVDASHARIEEDDAVDNEGHGLPESIECAVCLNFQGDIPFIGRSSIQTIHCHRNHT